MVTETFGYCVLKESAASCASGNRAEDPEPVTVPVRSEEAAADESAADAVFDAAEESAFDAAEESALEAADEPASDAAEEAAEEAAAEEAAAEEASAPEALPHPAMERIIRPVNAIANTFFIFILKNLLLHKKSVFCSVFSFSNIAIIFRL